MGKILSFLIALVFFLSGSVLVYAGVAHRDAYGDKAAGMPDLPPPLAPLVKAIKKEYLGSALYRKEDDLLQYNERGLLFLSLPGGLLLLIGFRLLLTASRSKSTKKTAKKPAQAAQKAMPVPMSVRRPAAAAAPASAPADDSATAVFQADDLDDLLVPVAEEEEEEEEAPQAAPVAEQAGDGGEERQRFLIPNELLGGEFNNPEMFYDIETVVSLSQSNVNETQFQVIVAALRPEYLPYVGQMTDSVKNRLGRQVVQHHVMRLKRSEQGISPDQFSSQDKRMGETERETICRRFMPKNTQAQSSRARAHFGKAYTLTEQNKVQQETQSDADDWQDISLRNFVSVMQQKLPGAG